LAAAMRSLVDHPHRRREMSAAARRRAENAFDAQTAASKSIQQYEQVLAER
jgi:glycosyltransferase involved in cell wall biosynthesis